MNNTQDTPNVGLTTVTADTNASHGEDSSTTSSERRPKPIRGVGLGDIFASNKSKPLIVDSTGNLATERLSTTNLTNSLQKQIPKKPPPPTPNLDNINGTNSNDQAPALPPKPANQFSPHLQHHTRSFPPTVQPQHHQHQPAQQTREQARVIYAYEPSNDDELAMEVGDIIDIIDKDIEDAGWWKGELRGKIGVFPDNFVQLIEPTTEPIVPSMTSSVSQDWQHQSNKTPPSQPMASNFNQNSESKFKSVFAATPKGFSRELENNLEKQHNSPTSFLSLKRNKLQLQSPTTGEATISTDNKGDDAIGPLEALNPTKLNHITVNRAKGPSRRPPSNFLNRRNQLEYGKRESNGKDDPSLGSLPISQTSQSTNHDILSSLPSGQQNTTTTPTIGTFSSKSNDPLSATSIKPSLSLDNFIETQTTLAPKAGQRGAQQQIPFDKSKTASTPPWMLELLKKQTEKKKDSPSVNQAQDESNQAPSIPAEIPSVPILTNNIVPTSTSDTPVIDRKSAVQSLRGNFNSTPAKTTSSINNLVTNSANNSTPSVATINSATNSVSTVVSNAVTRPAANASTINTSPNLSSEICELREEIKNLREDFNCIPEIKNALEVMKVELKACQSATENQKRYIKELVNNLADERKKIAAMQVEIDRNLR